MFATAVVEAGEIVVEVPDALVFSHERNSCVASELEAFFGAEEDKEEGESEMPNRLQRERLVVAVLCEIALAKEESKHAKYFAAMKSDDDDFVLRWTKKQKLQLCSTNCLDRLETYFDDECEETPSMTKKHYERVAKPFLRALAKLDSKDKRRRRKLAEAARELVEDEKRYYEAYVEAVRIVSTNAFTLGEDPSTQALVPFWDVLNHESPWVAHVRLSHDTKAKCLRMIATRKIEKGVEIMNTYGALGDGELLRRYGFVSDNKHGNPHNSVKVTELELIESCARALTDRFRKNRFYKKQRKIRGPFNIALNGRPSRELLLTARDIFSDVFANCDWFVAMRPEAKAMITTNFVLLAMECLAYEALHRYPSPAKCTVFKTDDSLLDRRRARLAVHVQCAERKCFESLYAWTRAPRLSFALWRFFLRAEGRKSKITTSEREFARFAHSGYYTKKGNRYLAFCLDKNSP